MDINRVSDRSRQLGKVLETCRENAEKTLVKTAAFLGISPDDLLRFERGETSPSLPQLELLADLFRIPINELIDPAAKVSPVRKIDAEKVPALVAIRSRIIAIRLKNARISQNIGLAELAAQIGIISDELEAIEAGEKPAPFTALEKACERLGISVNSLMTTPDVVGKIEPEEEKAPDLPVEWLEFIKDPTNLPYLQLARELKTIDRSALTQLGEHLTKLTNL